MKTAMSALVGCALVSLSVQAQDWPQWRGPNRDAKVTGFKAPAMMELAKRQAWTLKPALLAR